MTQPGCLTIVNKTKRPHRRWLVAVSMRSLSRSAGQGGIWAKDVVRSVLKRTEPHSMGASAEDLSRAPQSGAM